MLKVEYFTLYEFFFYILWKGAIFLALILHIITYFLAGLYYKTQMIKHI